MPLEITCCNTLRTIPSPVDEVFTAVAPLTAVKVSVVTGAVTVSNPVKLLCEKDGAVPPYSVENTNVSAALYPWALDVITPGEAEDTVHGSHAYAPR